MYENFNNFNGVGRYIDAKTLAQQLGISKVGLLLLCRKGQFPPGVRIGRARRWSVEEVKEWLSRKGGKGA